MTKYILQYNILLSKWSNQIIMGIWNPSEKSPLSSLLIPLTHYIEAAIEFADSISSSSLAHLVDLCPLVEVGVKPLHTGQWCHAIITSNCVHETLTSRGHNAVNCRVAIISALFIGFCHQSYPQRHRSHSSSGSVHRSHSAPAVTFDVVTLHVVEAGVVIQTSNGVNRTTKCCQGYTPPEKQSITAIYPFTIYIYSRW